MAEKAKPAKKKNGKLIFLTLTVILTVGLLVLIFGYIDFEFKKIGEAGFSPLSDWRSYLAFLMSKVPIVKNYVKYEPRKIVKPSVFYTEIYESYIEKIETDRQELENRAEELDKKDKRLKQLEAEINTRTQELDLKEERLPTETNNWEDQQKRYRQLAEWYENGETAKIALALSSDRISIEEIVSGLRFVEPGIASEIVGALANLNPDKAAQILAYLAGKEVIR